MSHKRRAKIIATLGPSTSSPDKITDLFESGVNVFRLNFSHGSHSDHGRNIQTIKDLEKKTKQHIGILIDLQGPKLRVGQFINGAVTLKRGDTFKLDMEDKLGNEERVCMPHPEIFSALEPGAMLLVNDGHLKLKVTKYGKDWANTEVVIPGVLSDNKGVNVPDIHLPLPAVTDKDKTDLEFGLQHGIDWVALSFVQTPNDIEVLRKIIGKRAAIIAKLEKPSALQHLDEIINKADAIMIARGDLGVEVPLEQVPVLQKKIIRKCSELGTPSVVATQMLESMIESPIPTRAEASDVATAIYDGADALMLSAETAMGRFPARSVSIMNKIITHAESDKLDSHLNTSDINYTKINEDPSESITSAAKHIAIKLNAIAIVTFTTSGSTTIRAAKLRPKADILCLTPSKKVAKKFTLFWGVESVVHNGAISDTEIDNLAVTEVLRQGIGKAGDFIVITAGIPFGTVGSTNMIKVKKISD